MSTDWNIDWHDQIQGSGLHNSQLLYMDMRKGHMCSRRIW